MLSVYIDSFSITKAIKNGINGYLGKGGDFEQIYKAIHDVYENGFYFNEIISFSKLKEVLKNEKIDFFDSGNKLNTKEIEIIRLICQQNSAKEIAEKLCMGVHTINSYRKDIMTKLGIKKIQGLVIYAIKNGIYTID